MHGNILLGTKPPPDSFSMLMQVEGHPKSAFLERQLHIHVKYSYTAIV